MTTNIRIRRRKRLWCWLILNTYQEKLLYTYIYFLYFFYNIKLDNIYFYILDNYSKFMYLFLL